MIKTTHLALLAGFCISASTPLGSLHGAIIFTDDFESPTLTTNTNPLPVPSGWTYSVRTRSDLNGHFLDGSNQVLRGFSNGGYVMQTDDFGATVSLGNEYTLSLDWYGLSNRHAVFEVRALAIDGGGTASELDSRFISTRNGDGGGIGTNVRNLSFSFTPTTNGGERLAIEINSGVTNDTAHHFIDNLVLDATVIPEPSTALLSGIGLLALLCRRRR